MSHAPIVFALLAAGASRRFGGADKLMATLGDAPLIARAGGLLAGRPGIVRVAIVPPGPGTRRAWLEAAGWQLQENPDAAAGQGTSVACAARAATGLKARALLIALADMPCVREATLDRLIAAMDDHEAAMCRGPEALQPPAIFGARAFGRLQALSGDRGARGVFDALGQTREIPLAAHEALDIDTPAELAAIEKDAAHA